MATLCGPSALKDSPFHCTMASTGHTLLGDQLQQTEIKTHQSQGRDGEGKMVAGVVRERWCEEKMVAGVVRERLCEEKMVAGW